MPEPWTLSCSPCSCPQSTRMDGPHPTVCQKKEGRNQFLGKMAEPIASHWGMVLESPCPGPRVSAVLHLAVHGGVPSPVGEPRVDRLGPPPPSNLPSSAPFPFTSMQDKWVSLQKPRTRKDPVQAAHRWAVAECSEELGDHGCPEGRWGSQVRVLPGIHPRTKVLTPAASPLSPGLAGWVWPNSLMPPSQSEPRNAGGWQSLAGGSRPGHITQSETGPWRATRGVRRPCGQSRGHGGRLCAA